MMMMIDDDGDDDINVEDDPDDDVDDVPTSEGDDVAMNDAMQQHVQGILQSCCVLRKAAKLINSSTSRYLIIVTYCKIVK